MLRIVSFVLVLTASLAMAPSSYSATDSRAKMDEQLDVPAGITLTFTAPIDASRSSVKVFGPSGRVSVGVLKLGAHDAELLIPLRANLTPGTYLIHFTAVATTGEQISGTSPVTVADQPASQHLLPSLDISVSK